MTSATETRRFEAEVNEVLKLVTHSLYSHKEIFLRELISNASDACDKLRFEALADASLLSNDPELKITVSYDAAQRTLSVGDSGIGMSRAEVIANIGTIASSGTRKFLDSLAETQRADAHLIGQFGVGFYSAFVVADRVTMSTRRAGAAATEGVRWESSGNGEYSLTDCSLDERGTTVTLHLKAEEDEFLDSWRLRDLIHRYSDHIGFPIRMPKLVDGKPSAEWDAVNQASALWTRPKSELQDADYQGFYKHLSHDFNDALAWSHNRVEGKQSFTTLLYVPGKSPFDLMFGGRDERRGLKLYVKRVFIMDAAEQMLPAYLRFVRGVVDSDDLPLNVSREILQNNKQVEQIRAACSKRVLDLLEKMASEDREKYAGFWKEFGSVLKEGIAEDASNKERIAKLLRFASSANDQAEASVALDDYIGRMKPGQNAIYYLTADSFQAARNSPHLEALRRRGVEVLLLADRVDEWMVGYLTEYAGKSLTSVAKGELDLSAIISDSGEASTPAATEAGKSLAEKIAAVLGDRVAAVRVSQRLTDSPSCIVLERFDMALHMQRILKQAGHALPSSKPTLEINPEHPLLQSLVDEPDTARITEVSQLLLEQAIVADGGQLDDPSAFVRRMNALILGRTSAA